jgi:hypothetical protein
MLSSRNDHDPSFQGGQHDVVLQRIEEYHIVNNKGAYLLAAYLTLLGILACLGWLYMGQADDAPGAGMIGISALLSSLIVGYRVARGPRHSRY